jgi:hypothetical protein
MAKKLDQTQLVECANNLHDNRLGMMLTGRIHNGKLELDKATQEELNRKFPNADKAFVAVNAPFDPVSKTI